MAKAKGLGDHLGGCVGASGESNWDESTRCQLELDSP